MQEQGQPTLQEHGHQIQEHDGHQVEDNEQQEEEILQQPLQEVQPENTPPQLVCRSTRSLKPSQRYPPSNYILLIDEGEPNCF